MAEALPGRLLLDNFDIHARVRAVAKGILGASPIPEVIVPVLNGALMFAADLMRELSDSGLNDLELFPIRIKRDNKGIPRIRTEIKGAQQSILNKNVLIVDGICDTGHTARLALNWAKLHCGAASVSYACLLVRDYKLLPYGVNWYFGYDMHGISDYVFGYGMDRNGAYRGLRSIRVETPSPDIPESILASQDKN